MIAKKRKRIQLLENLFALYFRVSRAVSEAANRRFFFERLGLGALAAQIIFVHGILVGRRTYAFQL